MIYLQHDLLLVLGEYFMSNNKKLWLFNFGAALLGFFWSFPNYCQMEYITAFALLGLAMPLVVYVIGLLLIFIFVPAANLGSLVIAMAWTCEYSVKLFLYAFIVFSIFVGFRANKWVMKNATKRNEDIETVIKRNNTWNKAGIIVLVIICILLEGLHLVVVSMKKQEKHDKLVQQEQHCQILIDTYRTVYSKYGNSFSNDDFIRILTTNPSIVVPANKDKYSPIIPASINGISSNFRLRRMGDCDITQENCYVYVDNSDCQFFFDKNGKIKISQYTKENYKNLK